MGRYPAWGRDTPVWCTRNDRAERPWVTYDVPDPVVYIPSPPATGDRNPVMPSARVDINSLHSMLDNPAPQDYKP